MAKVLKCRPIVLDAMTPELEVARQKVVERIPTLLTKRGTLGASGEGRFHDVDFVRDYCVTGEIALEKPQNGELSLILPSVQKSLEKSAENIGTKFDPATAEEPGKMPFELHSEDSDQERLALMRSLGSLWVYEAKGHLEGKNYFGLDANALWNCLFVDYVAISGDTEFRDKYLETFEKSHEWIIRQGRLINGGKKYPHWPSNQFWKDSENSLIDEDGNLPEYPVAPLDVNCWAYLSDVKAAQLFESLGMLDKAELHRGLAENRRLLINKHFWLPEYGLFAPAVDKRWKPVRIRTSDTVFALWCGVTDKEKADLTVEELQKPDLLTTTGLRTRSSLSRQFNSLDYQNGNVWNQLVTIFAAACDKLGRNTVADKLDEKVSKIADMDFVELHCEDESGNVTPYMEKDPSTGELKPVACRNQAWVIGGVLNRTAKAA